MALAVEDVRVAAADLVGAATASAAVSAAMVKASFGAGYQAVSLTAASVAAVAAVATWLLIRSSTTVPTLSERTSGQLVAAVEEVAETRESIRVEHLALDN